MVETALSTCFRNHIYQCKNEPFRQVVGGGIGARVTGVVARVLMDVWCDKLEEVLRSNDVTLLMLAKYVDDINTVMSHIPKGNRWLKKAD